VSAPAVTCATLLGAYTPVLMKVKQQQQQQEDLKQQQGQQLQGAREQNRGRSIHSQQSLDYHMPANTGKRSSRAGFDAAADGSGNRKRRLADDGQRQQVVQREQTPYGAASPITEDEAPADEDKAQQVLLPQSQEGEDGAVAGGCEGNGGADDVWQLG